MQVVYHNADEKVLIQSDKDADGRTIYLVVDGNVVNGQPSVKVYGIVMILLHTKKGNKYETYIDYIKFYARLLRRYVR